MKNSIVLTKAQFDIWMDAPGDPTWEQLVAESEKPELVEAWVFICENGDMIFNSAKDRPVTNLIGRLVKLREVKDEEV